MSTVNVKPPILEINSVCIVAQGCWQAKAMGDARHMKYLRASLRQLQTASKQAQTWDLRQIAGLDHVGAQLLWSTWGRKLPQDLRLLPAQKDFFVRIAKSHAQCLPSNAPPKIFWIERLGIGVLDFYMHIYSFVLLLGQLLLDFAYLLSYPHKGPWKEISANIYHAGMRALGVTALVGFLIGIVLSFLSSQQLRAFGGDIYLVNLLGMSVIRELGPMLAAILVAGRSGSAITAQIGVMRVTEELDAMLVMGIAYSFRLVLPKVFALAIVMPLLVLWTDMVALLGGMLAGQVELGLSAYYFMSKLPSAVPIANYWVGMGKGAVFGILIALVSCYFGLRIKPNTESLGNGTTTAVVTSITVVILADAIFAIVFRNVGFG